MEGGIKEIILDQSINSTREEYTVAKLTVKEIWNNELKMVLIVFGQVVIII